MDFREIDEVIDNLGERKVEEKSERRGDLGSISGDEITEF